MNKNLLTPNTAGCTTKSLKMMAAVICLTAVFVFTNSGVYAQENTKTQTVTKIEKTGTPDYINYKGIENIDEAKKAWFLDHPEEISGLTERGSQPYLNYKGIKNPKEALKVWKAENQEAAKIWSDNNQPQQKDAVQKFSTPTNK